MFSIWCREFNARLAVNGNKFIITLPLNELMNINAIKYTKIGNWIELSGTVEAPKVSSIINIDGSSKLTEPQGVNTSRHKCFSCRTNQGKEEERTEAQAEARTKQLF